MQQARASDELVPPFGFRWNDSMARVEAVLHGAKAKLVSREKKENREVLDCGGADSSRTQTHGVYVQGESARGGRAAVRISRLVHRTL